MVSSLKMELLFFFKKANKQKDEPGPRSVPLASRLTLRSHANTPLCDPPSPVSCFCDSRTRN